LFSINKGHDIFGRRDDFTKSRTKLPLKIPNEGSIETMQTIRNEIREELQKEMDLKKRGKLMNLYWEQKKDLTKGYTVKRATKKAKN
jgi:hypothetical protein